MATPTRWILTLAAASAATILAIGTLNLTFDPLQIFHRADFYKARYTSDERLQNAGLIRSQDFDTVLIGTSLAVHFRSSDIDRVLGGQTLKLAASGSTSQEQRITLKAALSRRPKRVIWEMDDWIFGNAPDPASTDYFPAGLYRMNIKGLCRYLLSLSTLRESLAIAARFSGPLDRLMTKLTWIRAVTFDADDVNELNTLPSYEDISAIYNRRAALASYHAFLQNPRDLVSRYDQRAMIGNFERDAANLIASHPHVHFVVYFPPYSMLYYLAMRATRPHDYEGFFTFNRFILGSLSKMPNVDVFDFRGATDITTNLNNYHDVLHHSPRVDQQILTFLKNGEHLVSRDEPAAQLDAIRAQAEAFSVD